ncbi:trehalose-phosphatase [Nitrospirillum iridis]|uniref:Trehalose 6-phosphate phosphatase n=1 Tax=Nitrospirillum iridis TaxID=765888 RepID=A0A7X0AWK4_9PROT|nr:trehalose-phosphatase [Nitrospirillum iridis]MBB6250616.1 trehalose 6-phosphate phosphatase [Nitrospirillum iridis]
MSPAITDSPPPTAPAPAAGDGWALFLDIDGTLLEHHRDPTGVVVDQDLRDLLTRLDRRLGGAVAVISGRSLASIDTLFQPMRLRAGGLFGIEMRLSPADPAVAAPEPPALAALAARAHAEFGHVRSIVIERKGPVLAIHTGPAPGTLDEVTRLAKAALPGLPPGYRIVEGNVGVELMPAQALKGDAVGRFMATEPFKGRRPIFIGDDVPDEHAFESVHRLGGVAVKVGRPEQATAAPYALADVAAVRAWLGDPQFPLLDRLARQEGRPLPATETPPRLSRMAGLM